MDSKTIKCLECGHENSADLYYCARCKRNLHVPLFMASPSPLTSEELRKHLEKEVKRRSVWRSFCLASWLGFLIMFLFCILVWGIPFGILGFLYLCLFAVPVIGLSSIGYYSAKEDCKETERKLSDGRSTSA